MVFCHISTDLKERALWLLEHDYIPEDACDSPELYLDEIQDWVAVT
jgi:hypothetical protein